MGIVGQTKHAVDTAATVAGKLDAWAKSADKAIADGKELNLFEDAIRGIKLFGQANLALQCLSMGLTAIGMLMGDKSQESQILDGINEVLGRIGTLESDVNARFAELTQELNLQTGQLELQSQLLGIENAENYLAQINKRRAKGLAIGTLEDDLAKFNPTDFSAAMIQIHDSCTGVGTPTAPNVLTTLYDLSFGDIRKVWQMGEYLLHKASSALILHGIVECIQSKRQNTTVDLTQIAGLYEDKIQEVASAFERCATDCISAKKRPANIKRFLDAKKVVPLMVLGADKQGSSSRIAAELQKQYDYLNFSVIVYEPVSGYEHHGVAGSGGCFMAEFRYPDMTNQSVNLIIYWANRTAANRQAEITYQSAAVDWRVFRGPRKDRSFDISFPDRPPGTRYQYVYDLAAEANKPTNNSPFLGDWGHTKKDLSPILAKFNAEHDRAKREPNSMIWFCFSDGYDDAEQSSIGMTSYNAMYGMLAPYTTICFWDN